MRTLLAVPLTALAAAALADTPATAPQTTSCIANFQIRDSRTTDAHEIIVRTKSSEKHSLVLHKEALTTEGLRRKQALIIKNQSARITSPALCCTTSKKPTTRLFNF